MRKMEKAELLISRDSITIWKNLYTLTTNQFNPGVRKRVPNHQEMEFLRIEIVQEKWR